MSIKALIVDDEKLARDELEYLLQRVGDVEIVAQGKNGIEAIELVRTHQPDVIFLDVQMPGLDGFAVLKKLLDKSRKTPMPSIVFATAFDQYAVRAFEVNAIDYVLKPFEESRIRQAIAKVQRKLAGVPAAASLSTMQAEAKDVPPRTMDDRLDALVRLLEQQQPVPRATATGRSTTAKVVLRASGRLLLIDQRDICFASIEEGTISVFTNTLDGQSNCRTLEELLELLNPELFWRAHRSFVVNIQHIQEVVPWFKSTYQLRMDDRRHTEIPVSRAQTKRLRELFNL
ncbi:MAG TPA: response regulator transcription factor [Acidobacteriaceae bacterium]|jgi:DNA-binding LytR/AlgR family response regulator|nr:response regulator transcription factor [Acidobacteriaceae bacterium]